MNKQYQQTHFVWHRCTNVLLLHSRRNESILTKLVKRLQQSGASCFPDLLNSLPVQWSVFTFPFCTHTHRVGFHSLYQKQAYILNWRICVYFFLLNTHRWISPPISEAHIGSKVVHSCVERMLSCTCVKMQTHDCREHTVLSGKRQHDVCWKVIIFEISECTQCR